MIIAMFLAHLVGDFILQWDRLAQWKSHSLQGILVHGSIIFAVTWLFALPFAPGWWQGIVFISLSHLAIDTAQFYLKPPIHPLLRFLTDQFLHFLMIVVALTAGGFITIENWPADIAHHFQTDYFLVYLLGYAFLTMPAWVLLKFLGYALLKGSGPSFPEGSHKYLGMLERISVATFILFGQFIFVPLVAVPRLILDRKQLSSPDRGYVQLFEFIAGGFIAIVVGLALR